MPQVADILGRLKTRLENARSDGFRIGCYSKSLAFPGWCAGCEFFKVFGFAPGGYHPSTGNVCLCEKGLGRDPDRLGMLVMHEFLHWIDGSRVRDNHWCDGHSERWTGLDAVLELSTKCPWDAEDNNDSYAQWARQLWNQLYDNPDMLWPAQCVLTWGSDMGTTKPIECSKRNLFGDLECITLPEKPS